MPVTRVTRRSAPKPSRAAPSSDDDIVVRGSVIIRQSLPKKKKRTVPQPQELIEIFSSEEDEPPPRKMPPANEVKELQQEIHKLKHKASQLATLETQLERAQKEIAELKRPGKVILDAAQLEDHLCCAICAGTMWSPYNLSNCGHTFCVKCLVEWFNTCLAQHMAANPNWHATNQPAYHLSHPRIRAHPYIAALIASQGPQPDFSCPTCRAAVTVKPIGIHIFAMFCSTLIMDHSEDFSLKAIIHVVATNAGESSPKKDPVPKRRGKGKAKVVEGPFDGFFGKD
ncbi:RING-type domain-containing protein [Favolaschia claudopus]|uniref:RING-type domain-containing protein n=1 Tax=Favolaschia claudopus TaxID=2862362 RepID=A0AAW0DWU3_9AGAR